MFLKQKVCYQIMSKIKKYLKEIIKNNNYPFLKKISGIMLILIGIPGLFLPILQGILFITAGVLLLGGQPALKKLKQFQKYIKTLFQNKNS